jgi:hypothetical protein
MGLYRNLIQISIRASFQHISYRFLVMKAFGIDGKDISVIVTLNMAFEDGL